MQINIRYTETFKQVMGIIIIPLLYMGGILGLVFSLPLNSMSEGIEMTIVMAAILIAMGASVFTIFRVMMELGEVSMDKEGLLIRLGRSTFLYPHKEMHIAFANVENASIDEEPGKSMFINLKTRVPSKSIMLFPEDYKDDTALLKFYAVLDMEIKRFNLAVPALQPNRIQSRSFYKGKAIQALAWVSLVFTAWLSFLKMGDPGSVSGWKLLMLYAYITPFCFAAFRPR